VPPFQGVLRPAVAPWADPGGQPAAPAGFGAVLAGSLRSLGGASPLPWLRPAFLYTRSAYVPARSAELGGKPGVKVTASRPSRSCAHAGSAIPRQRESLAASYRKARSMRQLGHGRFGPDVARGQPVQCRRSVLTMVFSPARCGLAGCRYPRRRTTPWPQRRWPRGPHRHGCGRAAPARVL